MAGTMAGRPAAAARVVLRGEVDLAAAPGVRRRLLRAVERAAGPVVVDLSEVTFMDSSGLSAIIGAVRRGQERGTDLVLTRVPRRIYRLLEITGMTWGVPGLRVEISEPPPELPT